MLNIFSQTSSNVGGQRATMYSKIKKEPIVRVSLCSIRQLSKVKQIVR